MTARLAPGEAPSIVEGGSLSASGVIQRLARGQRVSVRQEVLNRLRAKLNEAVYLRLPIEGKNIKSFGGSLRFTLSFAGGDVIHRGPDLIIQVFYYGDVIL